MLHPYTCNSISYRKNVHWLPENAEEAPFASCVTYTYNVLLYRMFSFVCNVYHMMCMLQHENRMSHVRKSIYENQGQWTHCPVVSLS